MLTAREPGFDAAVFIAAAAMSLVASWQLAKRLERLGERLGFSEGLLGLSAAIAADGPEITSAITALLHGQRAVGACVVMGANLLNLAALGLTAILSGWIALHRRVVWFFGATALWIALATLLVSTGDVPAGAGLGVSAFVFGSSVLLMGTEGSAARRLPIPSRWKAWLRSAVIEEEEELLEVLKPKPGGRRDAAVALFGLVVVISASVLMERAATALGTRYSIPDTVLGGAVIAVVAVLPNTVAAVYLALKAHPSATLSSALNSINVNSLFGFLVPAGIIGIGTAGKGKLLGGWYVGLTAVTLALALRSRGLSRRAGSLIVVCYLGAVVALVLVA